MRHDLTHAVRSLWHSPIFALTAIVTITLGIGASTAIFSVANAVLLRPLPYKDPDRLVLAWVELRARHQFDGTFSVDNFLDLRAGAPLFEDLAVVNSGRGIFPAEDGTLEQVRFRVRHPQFLPDAGCSHGCGTRFHGGRRTAPAAA